MCVDVPEGGTFLLGSAADGPTSVAVNGEPVVTKGHDVLDRRSWELQSLQLCTGNHQLDVWHDGAAVGVDLAGPFTAVDLAADPVAAAGLHEQYLVWTSDAAVGHAFGLDAVAWSCPDGTTFSGCDVPACVVETVVDCE